MDNPAYSLGFKEGQEWIFNVLDNVVRASKSEHPNLSSILEGINVELKDNNKYKHHCGVVKSGS